MDKFTKRVFISVPMRDRTDEQIIHDLAYLWKVAELRWGEPLEPVTNFFVADLAILSLNDPVLSTLTMEEMTMLTSNKPIDIPEGVCDPKVYYVSQAIAKMATCDYFVYFDESSYEYDGCYIEESIAHRYEMDCYSVAYPGKMYKNEEPVKEFRCPYEDSFTATITLTEPKITSDYISSCECRCNCDR